MLLFLIVRLLTWLFPGSAARSVVSRRRRECLDNFAGLHERLGREQLLHAVMLSRRHFKGGRHA